MKNIILLFLVVSISILGYSQTQVQLSIKHGLNGNDYGPEVEGRNDKDQAFKLQRVQYYVSNITLTDIDGKEIFLPDTYLFVDANNPTTFPLGSHDVSDITKLSFYIGVDAERNHADPSQYDANHALAPKNPSMHWSWAGGYRFAAMEGKAGSTLADDLIIHATGDPNFKKTTLDLNATKNTDDILEINLHVDYAKLFSGMDISSGLIYHGKDEAGEKLLENFRKEAITPVKGVPDNTNDPSLASVAVYPNPIVDGKAYIRTTGSFIPTSYALYDISGKKIKEESVISKASHLVLSDVESGVYTLIFTDRTKRIERQRIIIK